MPPTSSPAAIVTIFRVVIMVLCNAPNSPETHEKPIARFGDLIQIKILVGKAMAKPKFKPRGVVRPDTVFHLCSRFDGEWYATITARSNVKDADPIVAIAGPFADLEQAKAHNGQCMELNIEYQLNMKTTRVAKSLVLFKRVI